MSNTAGFREPSHLATFPPMSVVWDAPLARAVAGELTRSLSGARLRALLLEPDPLRTVLFFREATLALRLHPTLGHLTRHPPLDPPPEARALHARLLGVAAPPDERRLHFELRRVRGGHPVLEVIVELMTNQWNVLVVEGPEARIRHVLRERVVGSRRLAVGETYAPPPSSARKGIDDPPSEDEWLEWVGSVDPGGRRRLLLGEVAFTSSLNAPACLGRGAAGRPEGGASASVEDLRRGYRFWCGLREPEGAGEPYLVAGPAGPQPYPVALPPLEVLDRPPDLLTAFRLALEREARDGAAPPPAAALLPERLLRGLRAALEGAERKVSALERELRDAPDPDDLRAVGDLLLARFREVPRGATGVVLTGFAGHPVEVDLDPALPPQENAAAYYDRAGRAERARERLPALIDQARARRDELDDLLDRARRGEVDPAAVRDALPPELEDPGEGGGRPGEPRTAPYRRYRSSGGLEIRVGRGARGNDDLTFHHSSPDDVWLHARHTQGAHVILRWGRADNPPARDLAEAAVLAALHSRARTSGSVPVDWTRRKHVRKPRRAPPGAVLPDRVQTVFVEPDPDVEERLREE